MAKINDKLFIELYNLGKNDFEISQLLGVGERTVSRYAQRLRTKKKIKSRTELQTTDKLGLDKIKVSDVEKKIKSAKQEWQIPKSLKNKNVITPFKVYRISY